MVVFGILYIQAFGIPLLWSIIKYLANLVGYNVWKLTFEEDWTPEGKYLWWSKLMRLVGRALKPIATMLMLLLLCVSCQVQDFVEQERQRRRFRDWRA
jgi:hypothetical protein